MLRTILGLIARLFFKLFSRIEVTGVENIPPQGGAILAPNHISRLDAGLVFIYMQRRDVTGLVADKYKSKPFFRWLIGAIGPIWINRESADFQALREARDYLQNGGLLGVAPEGTRSKTGALMRAKTGVAYLADKAASPIIPIAITGTEKFFSELKHLRRARLTLRIGEPFSLPPVERGERSEGLQRNTDEIMCRIAAMLPPSYRGVYSDHPRLLELVSE
ncbi:MAG: 1-acyl-sn-glycerol-3-phosphate acyltransferase [Anaerolineales bacterium]|nr:1-acyl-sn-glycerol-3-phosphate acyltransferase [Anaerolineales bacterium]